MFSPFLGDANAQPGRLSSGVWDKGSFATQYGPLSMHITWHLLEMRSFRPHLTLTVSESVFYQDPQMNHTQLNSEKC